MLVQYFHFALTGGVEMQKMFDPRMRRVFCLGQNNEMRSKYISYKSAIANNTVSWRTWPFHCCIIVNDQ